MKSLFTNNFNLYMLPLDTPDKTLADRYQSALDCWQEVWQKVQENFSLPGPLFTDGFMRQTEGAFIYHGAQCAGLLTFRVMDFDLMDFSHDSYFKEWPPEDLRSILALGRKFMLATYMTVHPQFRNFHPEVKFKQVLMNIMIKRFRESECDLILNTSRRDRGINEEGFKMGGILLRENVEIFSGRERVDLIYYTRASACENTAGALGPFTAALWANRNDWKMRTSTTPKAA